MTTITQKNSMKVKITLLLLSIIISLVFVELMLRAVEYFQYVKSSNQEQNEQYNKIYSDERDKDYIFGHKPNANVKLERGHFNFTFISNSEGLRETRDYKELNRSIIFLGDSIIEGASVENHETMDDIFEKHTGITALNFGVGSSNTVHEFHWLKSKYKKSYNTKLIILGFSLSDFSENIFLRYFDPSLGNWKFYKYLSNNTHIKKSNDQKDVINEVNNSTSLWQKIKNIAKISKLARFIYSILHSIRTTDNDLPPLRFDEVDKEQKYYTELYINKIRDFSRKIESEFVVIIFPQKSQLQHQYGTHKRMQDALIPILEKNDIQYIDLYEIIKANYQTRPDLRWFHDDSHPYKEGHRFIGEYLAKQLPQLFPKVFE